MAGGAGGVRGAAGEQKLPRGRASCNLNEECGACERARSPSKHHGADDEAHAADGARGVVLVRVGPHSSSPAGLVEGHDDGGRGRVLLDVVTQQ